MRFDKRKGEEFLKGVVTGRLKDQVCIVAVDNDIIKGFIVGAASEPVFSSAKVGMELGWWVDPEYRGTRDSFMLFKAYEDWCFRVGCSHIQAAYLPGVSPDLTGFYKKLGYTQVESSFVKVIRM